jgi:hypothetical protein
MLHVYASARWHWTAAETAKNVGSKWSFVPKKYPGISATLRYLGEVQVERDAYRFSGSTRRCDWEIEIESIIPEMTTYLLRQRGTQYREGSEM